jgi:hypothetical protein
MTTCSQRRVSRGDGYAELLMPGVFEVSNKLLVGVAIDEVLLLAEASVEGEWEGQERGLPL